MELAPAVVGQMLVTGVLVGSIYGAVAMGFSLIFGVVRIVNFAHAGGVVWAMYAVFLVASSGVAGPYLATALVIPVFFGLGYVLQRALMVRIADMTEEMHIVFTFGLLLVLTYLAQFAFGHDVRFLASSDRHLAWGGIVIQREILVPDHADQHVLDRRRAGRACMHRDEGVLAQDQGIEAGVREASAQCRHRPRHRGG